MRRAPAAWRSQCRKGTRRSTESNWDWSVEKPWIFVTGFCGKSHGLFMLYWFMKIRGYPPNSHFRYFRWYINGTLQLNSRLGFINPGLTLIGMGPPETNDFCSVGIYGCGWILWRFIIWMVPILMKSIYQLVQDFATMDFYHGKAMVFISQLVQDTIMIDFYHGKAMVIGLGFLPDSCHSYHGKWWKHIETGLWEWKLVWLVDD